MEKKESYWSEQAVPGSFSEKERERERALQLQLGRTSFV